MEEKCKYLTTYNYKNCNECMSIAPYDKAPYNYCCRLECGQHEFCRYCDVYSSFFGKNEETSEK